MELQESLDIIADQSLHLEVHQQILSPILKEPQIWATDAINYGNPYQLNRGNAEHFEQLSGTNMLCKVAARIMTKKEYKASSWRASESVPTVMTITAYAHDIPNALGRLAEWLLENRDSDSEKHQDRPHKSIYFTKNPYQMG